MNELEARQLESFQLQEKLDRMIESMRTLYPKAYITVEVLPTDPKYPNEDFKPRNGYVVNVHHNGFKVDCRSVTLDD